MSSTVDYGAAGETGVRRRGPALPDLWPGHDRPQPAKTGLVRLREGPSSAQLTQG